MDRGQERSYWETAHKKRFEYLGGSQVKYQSTAKNMIQVALPEVQCHHFFLFYSGQTTSRILFPSTGTTF